MALRTPILAIVAAAGLMAQTAPPAPAPSKAPAPETRPRMRSTGMRNENVAVNPIDNNAIKEANNRVGTTTTLITEPRIDSGYFATEFGRPASPPPIPALPPKATAWHGELFGEHQNSITNARAFFQVGGVQPSRRNYYGGRATGELGKRTTLSATADQRKVRGMVNGNVLVPLATERTTLATDPVVRSFIQSLLDKYPAELPNRPDFDPRALNTNAPQRIDEISSVLQLTHDLGRAGRLFASHNLRRNRLDAFQLVAGQNPDAEVHTHRGQLAWQWAATPETEVATGFTFSRARSHLGPEPNAAPMRVRMGFQIQELGPDNEFPVSRALNSFRYGAVVSKRAGSNHQIQWGGDLTRSQLNGVEASSSRGYVSFTNNFGRPAIENFLRGTPSFYEVTIGEFSRGFRNWTGNAFAADRWQVNRALQLSFGLRYNLVTGPTEVNNFHSRLYQCDCNNFSPRVALAWRMRGGWVSRASYTVSFADIPPVTYQQVRFNTPWVSYIQVQNPDLLNPLAGIDIASSTVRTSPTILSDDLVSPYAHQAGLSFERRLSGGFLLRTAYVGSRSLKLLSGLITNRAQPREGIPLTLATVDQRRADPRFYEIRRILNAGIGHFHAGQVSLDLPYLHGLRANAAYTFSKAIDDGGDFTSTAANGDLNRGRGQSEFDALPDKRGLSNFDSPHAFLGTYSYDLPGLPGNANWIARLTQDWQIAGVVLAKTGTPLTLYIGSDAPGFGNVDGSPSDRPNILDPSILGSTLGHPDAAPSILSRDKFAYIVPGEPRGNVGRGTFRKARISNWNAALTKQWVWGHTREWRAQFRAEVYNATNTPQFDEPARNLTAPSFGRITNTLNDGRAFQLGIRLLL